MPTPFAVFLASDHDICELADELIHDEQMHLHNLVTENLVYFQIGGLTPKAADAFGFGKVEKKTGTDALAYLGRFGHEAARRSMETTCDMDETVFLVKISRRWWEAAGLDVKQGATIRKQNLHRLLCSIVPSESGGQIAKPDITIYTEQVAAFGKDLADLNQINKLLERYDSGGQEQLPLGEDSNLSGEEQDHESAGSPPFYPALPAVGENLPAIRGEHIGGLLEPHTDKFGINGTGKGKKSTTSEGNGGSRRRKAPQAEPTPLFTDGKIAPALSATQQAADFANQLAGGS